MQRDNNLSRLCFSTTSINVLLVYHLQKTSHKLRYKWIDTWLEPQKNINSKLLTWHFNCWHLNELRMIETPKTTNLHLTWLLEKVTFSSSAGLYFTFIAVLIHVEDIFSSSIGKRPKYLYNMILDIFNGVLLHNNGLKWMNKFCSFIIWNQIPKQMFTSWDVRKQTSGVIFSKMVFLWWSFLLIQGSRLLWISCRSARNCSQAPAAYVNV